jgi:hypothetical protein
MFKRLNRRINTKTIIIVLLPLLIGILFVIPLQDLFAQ